FKTQPLCVTDRTAGHLDLSRIEVDPKHAPRLRRLAKQAGEEPGAAAESDDETVPRHEFLHERQVRQECPPANAQARADRCRAVTVHRTRERRRAEPGG